MGSLLLRSVFVIGALSALAAPALAQESASEAVRALAKQDAELASTCRVLDHAIAVAEGTVKAYDTLAASHEALQKRLAGLMTNDEGKRLAATLDPVLAREAVQRIETPVFDPVALDANRKQASALVDRLKKEREAIVPGYVPPEAILAELQLLSSWASSATSTVALRNDWLDKQLDVADEKFDAASAPTLRQVLAEFRRREQDAWKAAREEGRKQAAPEGAAAITDAARRAELEKQLQEARQLLDQSRADLLTRRGEQDTAVARQKEEYERNMAELRRELALSKAQRQVQDAETQNVARRGEIDAEKIKLRQEAQDPAIQKLLAPLLAKGYSQPGDKERQLEATPVSLSKLRAFGALARDEKGLTQLARAGMKQFGTTAALKPDPLYDRPEWGYPKSWSKWTQEQRNELLNAQDTLNRLGETMVEAGMLAP